MRPSPLSVSAAAAFALALCVFGCQSAPPAGSESPENKKAPAKPSEGGPEKKREGQWASLVEMKVEGMHCADGCAVKVRDALQAAAGAGAFVAVDFDNKWATVRGKGGEKVEIDRLVKAVHDVGFKAQVQ